MQEQKDWFAVDKEGLRELQLTKPKHYLLRELIQNAWDENVTTCDVETNYDPASSEAIIISDKKE